MRLAVTGVVVLFLSLAGILSADPVVNIGSNAVVATGLTPGAKSAWFGLSKDPDRQPLRITRSSFVLVADGQGAARLERPDGVLRDSIWIVADLANGGLTITAPSSFKIKESKIPTAALKHRANGVASRLDLDADDIELFYIRPGVGAWRLSAGGKLPLDQMKPVDDSPAPPTDFAAKDLIVAVDPFDLTVRTLQVR